MQRLEVSGAVRPIYGSLDVKRLTTLPLTAARSKLQAAVLHKTQNLLLGTRSSPSVTWAPKLISEGRLRH